MYTNGLTSATNGKAPQKDNDRLKERLQCNAKLSSFPLFLRPWWRIFFCMSIDSFIRQSLFRRFAKRVSFHFFPFSTNPFFPCTCCLVGHAHGLHHRSSYQFLSIVFCIFFLILKAKRTSVCHVMSSSSLASLQSLTLCTSIDIQF